MLSLLLQDKTEVTKSGLEIDIRFCDNIAYFLKQKLYGNFQWIQFKSLNPVQSFQGDNLLITTEAVGVPGTLLIDLTMKPPIGFNSVNLGLVIGKVLTYSLLFHYNIAMYKIFNKLNMINKTYLHPIRTSDYSNSASWCHVLTSHPTSNQISLYSNQKLPS